MGRFFNTAGPIKPARHYFVPPLSRIDHAKVLQLIDEEKYFVLHAPRQTGKTTTLLALAQDLKATGRYTPVYANLENAQANREDLPQAMATLMDSIAAAAQIQIDDSRLYAWRTALSLQHGPAQVMFAFLRKWAEETEAPIVLFLDEVDALIGDTLISLLRQLRSGYTYRPDHFPQSIVLCGVRDVRDYRIHSTADKSVITGGSAFNIKAESLRVHNLTPEELTSLYAQHTEATGQTFEGDALAKAWQLTRGQPWLVNALAYQVCFATPAYQDRRLSITAKMIEDAKEELILRRDTHLDQLVDKLTEPRIRRVMTPILSGTDADFFPNPDDVQYAIDLGLIERREGSLHVANPVYTEIIPRELTDTVQMSLPLEFQTPPYVRPDHTLDTPKLFGDFQAFFREGSESWTKRFLYEEASVQLLLQAFLQRIINGGGRVEREYALGRRRTDLLLQWPTSPQGFHGPVQKIVVELKILHKSYAQTLPEALRQTAAYVDRTRADEGHIVLVDRTPTTSWDDKIFRRAETFEGRNYTIWGM